MNFDSTFECEFAKEIIIKAIRWPSQYQKNLHFDQSYVEMLNFVASNLVRTVEHK